MIEFYKSFGNYQAMIFVNKKATAEFLQELIYKQGKQAYILTSKMNEQERDKAIDSFRRCEFPCLISTNVLARGIDVPSVDIVINYDIPLVSEFGYYEPDYANYLHRVGRTGRFGTDGLAISFAKDETELNIVKKIAAYWEREIPEIKTYDEFMKIFRQMRPDSSEA